MIVQRIRSWVRVLLEAWMCVCVCVFLCFAALCRVGPALKENYRTSRGIDARNGPYVEFENLKNKNEKKIMRELFC